MVMQYWQRQPGGGARPEGDIAEIENNLHPDAKQGVRASEMQRYFEQSGLSVRHRFHGRVERSRKRVAAGKDR